jgi:hypothetical protein
MDFSPPVRAFLGSRGEGFALMAVMREVIGMKVRRDQIWERLVQMSMYTKCGEVGSVITDPLKGIASTLFETISEVAIAWGMFSCLRRKPRPNIVYERTLVLSIGSRFKTGLQVFRQKMDPGKL